MLKRQDQVRNPTSCPPGYPGGAIQGKKPPKQKYYYFHHILEGKKNILLPDHQGHQFRIPTFQKIQIGPFFDPFLPQKWQKKGQNVGGPKNFSSGWIFCFSLVFNYFNQFLYGIFLKSLKIEIESCTEPKTLGRSKNLKFASCQYF